tara:strand:- start:38502 stop:40679 length:2178 start_codon:yes stop_codon:yes gene_type:complete
MQIIRVALDVPVNTLFDYVVPSGTIPRVGVRVQVPFGRRMFIGVIFEVANYSSFSKEKLKFAKYIFNDIPALPKSSLDLFKFCSEYYQYPIGEVVMNGLPTRLRTSRPFIEKPQIKSQFYITNKGKLVDSAVISKRSLIKLRLLALFKESRVIHISEIKQVSAGAIKVLKEFLDMGWVEEFSPELKIENDRAPILKEEQATVIKKVTNEINQFNTWLLHGITGSGKTEIYMRLVFLQLLEGRQTLVLIPEINLTPQLEADFRTRFPTTSIISIHSGLNASARSNGWLQALNGSAKIILGTRLSVFTPISNLGLIIVDEEQDNSFKQQSGLCYSARDLAVFRAKYLNIPVVLGSATPSLESYHNAISHKYRMLHLYSRAADNASLPSIKCIDTRAVKVREGLSDLLITSLEKKIKLNQQSLIFINRRGFAPVLMCNSCSWVAACSRCASRLVVHLKDKNLCCHYCGYKSCIPSSCPECGDKSIAPFGHGTQRIESVLKEKLPNARILRIDRDSMRRKEAWEKILEEIHEHRVDILVGTQILAKGHNFPNLGLVGVLNPDASLYSTDFRATEYLFSQLMQVAGRAGRASSTGEVLIQTKFPNHPLYKALQQHNYEYIAKMLLAERRVANFPPYVYQALLRVEAPKLSIALDFLERVMLIACPGNNIEVFDPVPAQMAKLKGMERAHLLVQSDSRKELQKFLTVWRVKLDKVSAHKIRWTLDVDPVEF